MNGKHELMPAGLENHFNEFVTLINEARKQVYRVANASLIELYWHIGEMLSGRIATSNWGEGVIKQLSHYIARNTSASKGFSDKNLWRMKQFYETYRSEEKLSTLLREISWSHNLAIMSRCKSMNEREFYLKSSIKEHWSVRELDRQITAGLFERSMLDQPKLSPALKQISPESETAFRDRYVMEFLGNSSYKNEYSMKQAIIAKMKDFVLEVGKDFIFIEQEYNLQVGNEDFRIDLLFYNRQLSCLVAFEVKMGRFHPSHLGQLEFYLEALDRDVKKPHEKPSIGILLCKDKDDEVVEYAMARSLSPTLVAEYQLSLPDKKLLQAKIKELFSAEWVD